MSRRPVGVPAALAGFLVVSLTVGAVSSCARGPQTSDMAGSGPLTPRDSAADQLFGMFATRSSAEMWRIDSTLRAGGRAANVPLSAIERAVWLDTIAAYATTRPAERLYLPGDARPWVPACVWLRPQLHHTSGDGGYRTFGPAPDTLVLRCRGDAIAGGHGQIGGHWRQVHDPTCDFAEDWSVSDSGEVLGVNITCGHEDTHGHRGYGDGHFGKPHVHSLLWAARTVSPRQRAIARRLARVQGGQVPTDADTELRAMGRRIRALGR